MWSETSLDPDNRSHYAVATLVNNTLDRAELGLIHRNGFKQLPPTDEGAVVIVHGTHQATQVSKLLEDLKKLTWAVIIVIGDEAAVFPVELLRGPRRKIWMQMPVPGRHDFVDRKLICGFPHDAPAFLEHHDTKSVNRPLNWFYAGQVNHASRRECVAQLKMTNNGLLFESPSFWSGLPRDEYYGNLCRAKVAPCPTGAATPDTLRVAEALEAGCVPIVEDRWPPGFPRTGPRGLTGYWKYVLGEEPPFPVLTDWRNFPLLVDQALKDWPVNRDWLQIWWKSYKERMRRWLLEDVINVR